MKDSRAYRAWLRDAIARDTPTRLVPSHGDVLEDEALPARLLALADARLQRDPANQIAL